MIKDGGEGIIKAFGISIIALMAPIQAILFAIVFLIILEFFTGIICSFKYKKANKLESLKLTLWKLLVYPLAVLAAMVLQKYLIQTDAVPIINIISSAIGSYETLAVLKNLNKLYRIPAIEQVIALLQPEKKQPPEPELKKES